MKKILFAALAATFMFVSCSKDDGGTDGPNGNESAQVVIKFNPSSLKTRAYDPIGGDNLSQDKVEVKHFALFVFANGTLQGSRVVASGAIGSSNEIVFGDAAGITAGDKITTNADKVVLIGNYPSSFIPANVTSLGSLSEMLFSLDQVYNDYTSANPKKIVIFGTNDAAITFDTDTKKATTAITPSPIPARIDAKIKFASDARGFLGGLDKNDIEISKDDATYQAAVDAYNNGKPLADQVTTRSFVEFKGVAVLYSGTFGTYLPGTLPTKTQLDIAVPTLTPTPSDTRYLYSGLYPMPAADYEVWQLGYKKAYIFEGINDDETAVKSFLHGAWDRSELWNEAEGSNKANLNGGTTPSTAISTEFTRSYYALPPTQDFTVSPAVNANTILTAYGLHYKYVNVNGAWIRQEPVPIFWPVHFSPSEDATVTGGTNDYLKNGYRYEVTMEFSKDIGNGAGGSGTPEIPVVKGELTVTINQAKWAAFVQINKPWEGGN